jgi:hypothetical protein
MRKKVIVCSAVFLVAAACMAFGFPGVPCKYAVASEAEVVEHTVLKGDNLMLLAGYYFKDPRQWRRIYSNNMEVVRDPNLLIPGTVLRIEVSRADRWHIPYQDFTARAGY